MKEKKQQPLVVTTAHKGVFFGYGISSDKKTIVLKKARMCIYWSADVRGVMGLAVSGPKPGCKVGPAVSSLTLLDVTAVLEASAEAASNWEKEIWNQ